MKVLVTGATGFVGGWLTNQLIKDGYQVRAIVRDLSQCQDFQQAGVELFKGDITDKDSLIKAMTGVEVVFHLAGVIGYSKAQRKLMDEVNVGGTLNVVEAMKICSVPQLIYMSSVVAIGASFDGKTPLNEQSPYNIKHLNLGYFETKRLAEEIVMSACRENFFKAITLNPSTIYGPGDAKKGSRKTQVKVAKGNFPFYTNGGVSIISVRDVVSAIIAATQKGRNGERYILSGENITIKKLFEIIANHAGVEPPKIQLPNFAVHTIGKVGDIMENLGKKGPLNSENAWTATMYHWFANEKAKSELGLKPMSASEAIAESVGWMQKNNWLKQ